MINALVQRLNANPDDVQLREQIRTVDLLARKAYFTNQWQVRTGGYLLLISVVVLVLAMQMMRTNAAREVEMSEKENTFFEQQKARKWVAISGGALVVIAFVFALLTHLQLSDSLANQLMASASENSNNSASTPVQNPVLEEESPQPENLGVTEEISVVTENQTEESITDESAVVAPKKNPEKITEAVATEQPKKPKQEEKAKSTGIPDQPKTVPPAFPTEKEILSNHPSFRGSFGNGISHRKNIPVAWDGVTGENINWKVKIPLHGYNSPIIWGDKLFVSGANSAQREVYCLDRNTGEFLWTTQVSGIPGSPPTAPKVTDDTGQAAPSLTTYGQRVFAIFANGDLIALDMEGKQLWARNMGPTGNHYGHSSSLMLYQDMLILQYDIKSAPKLMGLSVLTGETVWETEHKVKISWASPIVVNTGNRTEIITVADPMVSSYDPATGKLNWEIDCIFGEVGPSAAYADGVVYAVNEYARLVAIQLGEAPEILWESDEYLSDVPSPVATESLLFMATSYGVMVCYDAKSGEILWEHEFDNGFYSSPMLAEGKIYLIDMAGIMHVFGAEREFNLLAESPLGEKCMTTPAFADNRIYIRGNDHLFCIGN
jgi:outer membrane protein assembly factor BamB